jgi:hypothetical protein
MTIIIIIYKYDRAKNIKYFRGKKILHIVCS